MNNVAVRVAKYRREEIVGELNARFMWSVSDQLHVVNDAGDPQMAGYYRMLELTE